MLGHGQPWLAAIGYLGKTSCEQGQTLKIVERPLLAALRESSSLQPIRTARLAEFDLSGYRVNQDLTGLIFIFRIFSVLPTIQSESALRLDLSLASGIRDD